MKKLVVITLAVFMALSLVGCGSSSDTNSTGGNNSQTAWFEKNDKKETEYELRDTYYLASYSLEFEGNSVKILAYNGNGNVEKEGSYTRDKNIISCNFGGYEVKYRLTEGGLVCISHDVYSISAIASSNNPLVAIELKDVDFSALTEPTLIKATDSRRYLYMNGYVFAQFEESTGFLSSLPKVEINDFRTYFDQSFSGEWFDSYIEGSTSRYLSYEDYQSLYQDELDFCLKLMDYILVNKDSNPACFSAYNELRRFDGTYEFSFAQVLEHVGALYWTMGKFNQAKDAFGSIPNREAYFQYKYHREVVINDFNMITYEPTSSKPVQYVVDSNGFVLQANNKHYQYDGQGRLVYMWVEKDQARKYSYVGHTVTVSSVFADRYGQILHDEIYYDIIGGKLTNESYIGERDTVKPAWVAEIPCGL